MNIAVAGCGIAGMASALLLARQGHRVRIFERFAEARPVGSGLLIQPTGQAVLARLGLLDALFAAGARVTALLGKSAGRVALNVHYDWLKQTGACGIGIHRAALFDILHAAVIAAGIPIEGGRAVSGSQQDGARRRLVFTGGYLSAPFDLLVDALGASSPLSGRPARPLAYGALWTTLDMVDGFARDRMEQRYRRAAQMVGVLPAGRGKAAFFWSLRGDGLDAWRARGLDAWKADVLGLWPETAGFLDQIGDAGQLTFARYAHRTLRRAAEPALIHIGDAWHSTSPQLGQGANMALLDAWALARAIAEGGDTDAALARAVAARWAHVQLYQAMSILFTPAYQSDGHFVPFVRDRIVPPFARMWPATRIQAAMVAGTFGGPLKRLGLSGGDSAATSEEMSA